MNHFACAAAVPGCVIRPGLRTRLAAAVAAPDQPVAALSSGSGFAAASATGQHAPRPLLIRHGALAAAGDVRLDDRARVAAWGGVRADTLSDLVLVLAAYAERGAACLEALAGDFAFAIWDGDRGTLTAMRDPFGVRPLYLAHTAGALLLASRPGALAGEGQLDEEWIADVLVSATVPPERTAWAGVQAVAPGEVVTWRDGRLSRRRDRSAADLAPARTADEDGAVEAFHARLEDAVRVRMEGDAPVWPQLSGGLDSSSHRLHGTDSGRGGSGPGIAGTLTVVETLGDGSPLTQVPL